MEKERSQSRGYPEALRLRDAEPCASNAMLAGGAVKEKIFDEQSAAKGDCPSP
jgi:hypothetical protein